MIGIPSTVLRLCPGPGGRLPNGDKLRCGAHQNSGKVVTMDSGFCVSKGITSMEEEMGVYGQALIKKRGKYWSKGVPGNEIDATSNRNRLDSVKL